MENPGTFLKNLQVTLQMLVISKVTSDIQKAKMSSIIDLKGCNIINNEKTEMKNTV